MTNDMPLCPRCHAPLTENLPGTGLVCSECSDIPNQRYTHIYD